MPRARLSASSRAPIAARPAVRSTKRHAASTFGPIEPSAKRSWRRAAGVVARIASALSVSKSEARRCLARTSARRSRPRSRTEFEPCPRSSRRVRAGARPGEGGVEAFRAVPQLRRRTLVSEWRASRRSTRACLRAAPRRNRADGSSSLPPGRGVRQVSPRSGPRRAGSDSGWEAPRPSRPLLGDARGPMEQA